MYSLRSLIEDARDWRSNLYNGSDARYIYSSLKIQLLLQWQLQELQPQQPNLIPLSGGKEMDALTHCAQPHIVCTNLTYQIEKLNKVHKCLWTFFIKITLRKIF